MNKFIFVLLLLALGACSSEHGDPYQAPSSEGAAPEAGAGVDNDNSTDGTTDEDNSVEPVALSFKSDILPIIEQRCTLCHNESSGLPDWRDYQVSFNSTAKLLNRVTVLKNMPQGNATNMTQQERDLFAQWINDGAME